MPYKNVPKNKWKAMEKCTKEMDEKGVKGDSKYAICYSSIMGTLKKRFKNRKKK